MNAITNFIKNPTQVSRLIITALFTAGSGITAYYLFAFRVDKYGLYYKNDDQLGLAIGVGALVLAYLIRNWKKI